MGVAPPTSVRAVAARAIRVVAAACAPDTPFYLSAFLFVGTVAGIRAAMGLEPLGLVVEYRFVIFAAVTIAAVVGLAAAVLRERARSAGPPLRAYRAAVRAVRHRHLTVARLAHVIAAAFAVSLSLSALTGGRRLIPIVHPFTWDQRLDALERAAFGGQAAWQLASFARSEWLTILYHPVWFGIVIGAAAAAVVAPPSRLRTRFLLVGVLTQAVLGVCVAIALSSVGPVYFDPATRSLGPVEAVATALRDSGLGVLADGQARLWKATNSFGITAMPSMHVAEITVVAFAAHRIDRRLGAVAWAFTALIALGTVTLAWHYALDSVVAFVGVWALWRSTR